MQPYIYTQMHIHTHTNTFTHTYTRINIPIHTFSKFLIFVEWLERVHMCGFIWSLRYID